MHASASAKGRWRDTLAEISAAADLLCLCGDLTNHGTVPEAESLAEDLRACSIPVVAVLGNHDHHCGAPEQVEEVLKQAGVIFLEGEVHAVNGVGFAGVKGFCGGFDGRMLDAFGEAPIKAFVQEVLDQALRLEHALKELETERIGSGPALRADRSDGGRRVGGFIPVSRLLAAWPKPSIGSTRFGRCSTAMPTAAPTQGRHGVAFRYSTSRRRSRSRTASLMR